MRFRRELLAGMASAAVACFAIAVVGCGTGTSTVNQALVKSINTYVGPTGLDGSVTLFANTIYLTGGNIAFGTVANSGGYINLTSGTYNLTMSGPSLSPVSLNNQSFNGNNTAYTVLAAGQAGQSGTYAPQMIVMPNYVSNQLVLPSGAVAIRIVNVSLNPHPIGLFNTTAAVPTAAVAPTTTGIGYGYSSATNGYTAVTTTSLTNLAVVDTTTPTTAFTLPSTSNLNTQTFIGGNAYTLVVYGQPGNSAQPMSATWVQDYPAP